MNWNKNLTGPALDVAEADKEKIRAMAGPGTGKSFALQRRVARLLETEQDPVRMLAVTFTRNAAANLVSDLVDLNISGCEQVRASTLHSYCFLLLTSEDVFESMQRKPRIVMTFISSGSLQFEGSAMINDLIKLEPEFGDKRECTKLVRKFEAAWAGLQSEEPGWPTDSIDKKFNRHLREWLHFHNTMLLGELVPVTLGFLRVNPESSFLTAFDHIIVDEYQDLNRAEQEIINLLSNKAQLVIVGDVDQSIYSFRHAHPEGITSFKDRHPTVYDVPFTECWRCPIRVVSIANDLIANNHPPDTSLRLAPKHGNPPGEVYIVQWKTSQEEAKGVSEYIEHLINKQSYDPKDILIITPRRKLAGTIRDRVDKKNISIHSDFDDEVWESKSAQHALALLTLLNNKEDRVALRWWLGRDSKSSLSTAYQKLQKYCRDNNRSPREVLTDVVQNKLKLAGVSYLSRQFEELIEHMRELSALDLCGIVDYLLPKSDDSCAMLRKIAECALENSENINQLYENIVTDVTQPKAPDGDYVRIMSPHKSKGLSSKVVIVTGCSQGLFPFIDTESTLKKHHAKIYEQRNLFYVAITRCKEILVLSSFTIIERGDAAAMNIRFRPHSKYWVKTIASQFIGELGPTAPPSQKGTSWQASGYREAT